MGEAIERSGVPKWAWSIILTAFLALMSFTIGATAGNQKMKDNIKINSSNIERLSEEKASSEKVDAVAKEVDRVYEAIIRMEGKIDHLQGK